MRPPYPSDAGPFRFDGSDPPSGPGRGQLGRFGLYLFLASLTMFFAAGLAAYLLVRFKGIASTLEDASIRVPAELWVSTVVLLISGVTAHLAGRAARRARMRAAGKAVLLTFGLGLLFVGVQVPSLVELLGAHYRAGRVIPGLYGLSFTLILLHALHVLGGMVPLGVLSYRAVRGGLAKDQASRVHTVGIYWHFLDVVWLALFGTFLLTG